MFNSDVLEKIESFREAVRKLFLQVAERFDRGDKRQDKLENELANVLVVQRKILEILCAMSGKEDPAKMLEETEGKKIEAEILREMLGDQKGSNAELLRMFGEMNRTLQRAEQLMSRISSKVS